MIKCLKDRYDSKVIYTSIGPILMAMNPCKKLPYYTYEILTKYYNAGNSLLEEEPLEPHVFQISDRAYRRMFVDKFDPDKRENQSILLNGESGAGKTESTKHVLHYLAVVSSNVASTLGVSSQNCDIENQVVASNPITESFGNAKTIRNNNSSRFGKFIELLYTADGYIEGATIRTYLLETARVVHQRIGERNYHIFYEIFAGLTQEQKDKYSLTSLEDFYYVGQSNIYERTDGEKDDENFERVKDAMTTLQISESMQEEIIKIVIGILHLGNVEFEEIIVGGVEAAIFSTSTAMHLNKACELLGLSKEMLLSAVGRRSISVAGAEIEKTINAMGAISAKDTVAKIIYDRLFQWIVSEVNQVMEADTKGNSASFIGVLDIFGFECMQKNSFEQLCINYTNETLQYHFNYTVFISEQEVYEEEGLKWTFVDYPDNSERLDLLENRIYGIFPLCDEQLKLPKASDEKLAQSYYDKCITNKYFSASKAERVLNEFTIIHFAADVRYQTAGFLDKNRGDCAKEIMDCIQYSQNSLVSELATVSDDPSHSHTSSSAGRRSSRGSSVGGGMSSPLKHSRYFNMATRQQNLSNSNTHNNMKRLSVTAKKTTTVSSQFSRQLHDLMTKIRSTRSHFVRCIKPNDNLLPNKFESDTVLLQLKYGGVLGAVQVFRAGFPHRIAFSNFVNRYSGLCYPIGRNPMTNDFCKLMAEARKTGNRKLWKLAAAALIAIVPLAETVMNMLDRTRNHSTVDVIDGLRLGKNQVFLREPVVDHLDVLLHRAIYMEAARLRYLFIVWKTIKAGKVFRLSTHGSKQIATTSLAFFGDIKRYKVIKHVAATVTLQRRVRVFLELRRRKTIIHGCILLQAVFRGWKGRERVRKIRSDAATILQTSYRRHKLRSRYLRWKRAAMRIQLIVRSWLQRRQTRRRVKVVRLGKWALVRVQTMWRRYHAQLKFHEMLVRLVSISVSNQYVVTT